MRLPEELRAATTSLPEHQFRKPKEGRGYPGLGLLSVFAQRETKNENCCILFVSVFGSAKG